jgi:MFS family permease
MVQIDVPAAFIASQFFLDVGRKAIMANTGSERRETTYYRFLSRSLIFAGAVIAPAGIYLLAGWPGWEQIYWTERVEHVIFHWINALIPALFVLAIVLAAYLGHVLGYRWLTTGRGKYLRPTYLGLLLAVALLVLFNYPAFLLVGTYQQYHFSRAAMAPVWQNPHDFSLGWVLVMLYFAIALVCFTWRTWSDARECGDDADPQVAEDVA